MLLLIQSTLAYCWPAVQLHFAASSGRSSCPFVNLAAGPAVQLKLTGSSAWRPAGQASRRQAVQFQLAFLKKSTLGAHLGITLEAIMGVQRALREPKGRPKGPKGAQQAQKCIPKGAQRIQRAPKGAQKATPQDLSEPSAMASIYQYQW